MRTRSDSSRSLRSVASASAPMSGRSASRRARAHLGVGDEVDLHLGVGRDDGADVAALDHDVAVAAELALPLAHHLAHLGVPRDDRHHPVDPRLPDRGGHVGAGDAARGRASSKVTWFSRASAPSAASSPSGSPRCSASQVSARYIAPVSR